MIINDVFDKDDEIYFKIFRSYILLKIDFMTPSNRYL